MGSRVVFRVVGMQQVNQGERRLKLAITMFSPPCSILSPSIVLLHGLSGYSLIQAGGSHMGILRMGGGVAQRVKGRYLTLLPFCLSICLVCDHSAKNAWSVMSVALDKMRMGSRGNRSQCL